jgi:hypothetical protein
MFNVHCLSGLDLLVSKWDAKPNGSINGKIISASDGLKKKHFFLQFR